MEQSENNPTSELKSVIDEMYEELDMERPPEPDSDTDDENDTGLFIFYSIYNLALQYKKNNEDMADRVNCYVVCEGVIESVSDTLDIEK